MRYSCFQNSPKRRPVNQMPHLTPRPAATSVPVPPPVKPPTIDSDAVVCIDDDDDDIKVVPEPPNQPGQDSLYLNVWPEQQETDATNEQSLPGSMEQFQQSYDQSTMSFDDQNLSVDGTIPEGALSWDQLEQPGSSMQQMQGMMQQQDGSDGASQKVCVFSYLVCAV